MPQFAEGDRVFSHYAGGWGTIEKVGRTEPAGVHGVTGSPLPASTWYDVKMDKGNVEYLDDADGQWYLARILPPEVASRYGWGTDPQAVSR